MLDHSGPGIVVAIVGPSGSGKDTLISWLRQNMPSDIEALFVRRVVTREAVSDLEDHASISKEQFLRQKLRGAFAVTWQAHDLEYGIPVAALRHVRYGGIAVMNGSRKAMDDICKTFGNVLVIRLTVEQSILLKRLRKRGRETEAEINARIERSGLETISPNSATAISIDNSGDIATAGFAVISQIEKHAKKYKQIT